MRTTDPMPRPASSASLLPRGVWKAPWMGPNGEMVLLAVTACHALACPPVTIPRGSDHTLAVDQLWAHLEATDPDTRPASHLRVISLAAWLPLSGASGLLAL